MIMTIIYSCNKKDGFTTRPSFPTTTVVGSEGQTITLTDKNNTNWYMVNMTIDNKIISGNLWNTYPNLEYYPKNTENSYLNGIDEVDYSWFNWKKVDKNIIKIVFKKNETKKQRQFSFEVSVGNASQNILIIQE